MSTLILGSNGSMGKRYQAILRYLGRPFHGIDLATDASSVSSAIESAQSYIIATPTETHLDFVRRLAPLGKPILCEKPLAKTQVDLEQFFELLASYRETPFRMMLQYEMLIRPDRIGGSFYDYFRHGNDGLVWDCLQIIGLARGKIELRETSPVWACKINGQTLNSGDMDAAYIAYVQKWFKKPAQSLDFLADMHKKALKLEKSGVYGTIH